MNVTLRHVRLTILALQKLRVLHIRCVCSLSYPACRMHAPYCQLWRALFYSVFPRCVLKSTNFEKQSFSTRNVFWFSLQRVPGTFFIPRKTERDIVINIQYIGLHVKSPFFFSDFHETWIFSTDCRKILKHQISWNLSGWTDILTWRN